MHISRECNSCPRPGGPRSPELERTRHTLKRGRNTRARWLRPPCLWLAASAVFGGASYSGAAHADAQANACIAAHADGQVLQNNHQLLAARAKFLTCSAETCPNLVRNDCVQFLQRVDERQPTVVLAAVGADEHDVSGVQVALDGKHWVSQVDGSPIALDPGEHHLQFRAPDGRVREYFVVAREGEKARRIVARFDQAPPQPGHGDTKSASAIPTASYVFGGVGVLALASFGYFALRGHSTQSCAPHCTSDEVDRLHSQYLAADISLVIGLASLGAATYFFFDARKAHKSETTQSRLDLGAGASAHGFSLAARGHF